MQASYTVNVAPNETVEIIGAVDTLDKITMQMRTHEDLLKACELSLTNFQELLQPTNQHKRVMALLRTAIQATS